MLAPRKKDQISYKDLLGYVMPGQHSGTLHTDSKQPLSEPAQVLNMDSSPRQKYWTVWSRGASHMSWFQNLRLLRCKGMSCWAWNWLGTQWNILLNKVFNSTEIFNMWTFYFCQRENFVRQSFLIFFFFCWYEIHYSKCMNCTTFWGSYIYWSFSKVSQISLSTSAYSITGWYIYIPEINWFI